MVVETGVPGENHNVSCNRHWLHSKLEMQLPCDNDRRPPLNLKLKNGQEPFNVKEILELFQTRIKAEI
jgi:hypothetical protein